MRVWYKYSLNSSVKGKKHLPIEEAYDGHAKAMGGYGEDDSYMSQESFFESHFYGYHDGRLQFYDRFLRKHLKRSDHIFSIASGRCANEMMLMKDGFPVSCSDLGTPDHYQATKKLFPGFNFQIYNALIPHTHEKRVEFDAVMALSFVYLCDQKALSVVFENMAGLLSSTGKLILDAPSVDNVFSWVIHDFLLPLEIRAKRFSKFARYGRWEGMIIKHHGYRWKDREIIDIANRFGFKMQDKVEGLFLSEFTRSSIISAMVRYIPCLRPVLGVIGRLIPYGRIFLFQKKDSD